MIGHAIPKQGKQRVFFITLGPTGALAAVAEDEYASACHWIVGNAPGRGPFDSCFAELFRVLDPENLEGCDEEGVSILLAARAARRLW